MTLYECLAGGPLFRSTPHRIVRQILDDDPRPISVLNDAVPRDLETICLQAIARKPARSYASAADLAAEPLGLLGAVEHVGIARGFALASAAEGLSDADRETFLANAA